MSHPLIIRLIAQQVFLWVRGIPLNLGSSQSRARGVPGVMARGIPDAISVHPMHSRAVLSGALKTSSW